MSTLSLPPTHILIRLKTLKDLLIQLEHNIAYIRIDGKDVFFRLARTDPDSFLVFFTVAEKKGEWVALSENGNIMWSNKPKPGYLGVINVESFPMLEALLRKAVSTSPSKRT